MKDIIFIPSHRRTLYMPTRSPLIYKSVTKILLKKDIFANNLYITGPQGDSHDGSPGLLFFHKAKSLLFFFPNNLLPKLPSPSSIKPSFPADHGCNLA